MGYNNPPGKTAPTEKQDERTQPTATAETTDSMWTTNGANSSGANLEPSSYMPLGDTHFGWDDDRGTSSYLHEYENANNMLGFDLFANAAPDVNALCSNTEASLFPRQSTNPYPQGSMIRSNTVSTNSLPNNFSSEGYQELNFSPVSGNAINENVTEANANLLHSNTEPSLFPRQATNPYPQLSMRECLEASRSNTVSSVGYREILQNMHFSPVRGNAIKEHVAGANISGPSRSQMHGNVSSSGTSTSSPTAKVLLQHNPVPHSPGKVDGDFLTLGIGGGTNFSRSNHFAQPSSSHAVQNATNLWSLGGASANATRTQTSISGFTNSANSSNDSWNLAGASNNATRIQTSIGGYGNLENSNFIAGQESAPAQLNSSRARQNVNNPLSVAGATSNATRIQASAAGLPNWANDLLGRTSTSDRGAVMTGNTWPDTSEFGSLQTPRANEQINFLPASYSFPVDQIPASISLGNNFVSYPGHPNSSGLPLQQVRPSQFNTSQSHLALQQVRPSQFTTGRSLLDSQYGRPSNSATSQSNFNQQWNLFGQHERNSVDVFTNSVHNRRGGIPNAHQQLRNPTVLPEAIRHDSVPSSIRTVGQPYPRHIADSADARRAAAVQINHPPSAAVPFPRRLGVHPNDFATAMRARGLGPSPTAAQFNSSRLLVPEAVTLGQRPGVATHFSTAPGVDYSSGQVNRLANVNTGPQPTPRGYHQSMKRPATEKPPRTTPSQRRRMTPRITPQPYSNPLQSQSNHVPGPVAARIPAANSLHVMKGPDSEELPLPSGYKCFLCKRDLSFTAEGQVFQPTNLPNVAVLPCQHTFHDECLEKITSAEEATDPPCIPCALGET